MHRTEALHQWRSRSVRSTRCDGRRLRAQAGAEAAGVDCGSRSLLSGNNRLTRPKAEPYAGGDSFVAAKRNWIELDQAAPRTSGVTRSTGWLRIGAPGAWGSDGKGDGEELISQSRIAWLQTSGISSKGMWPTPGRTITLV